MQQIFFRPRHTYHIALYAALHFHFTVFEQLGDFLTQILIDAFAYFNDLFDLATADGFDFFEFQAAYINTALG